MQIIIFSYHDLNEFSLCAARRAAAMQLTSRFGNRFDVASHDSASSRPGAVTSSRASLENAASRLSIKQHNSLLLSRTGWQTSSRADTHTHISGSSAVWGLSLCFWFSSALYFLLIFILNLFFQPLHGFIWHHRCCGYSSVPFGCSHRSETWLITQKKA